MPKGNGVRGRSEFSGKGFYHLHEFLSHRFEVSYQGPGLFELVLTGIVFRHLLTIFQSNTYTSNPQRPDPALGSAAALPRPGRVPSPVR